MYPEIFNLQEVLMHWHWQFNRLTGSVPNMDDRRTEVQDDMHRKPERNDQNWRARGWKESYCRRYNRKGYHLDDIWRENYDDDDEDDKNNNTRSYPNQQCTFYNRNAYGSYSHNSASQHYVWNYGPHQLRPEPYRNSSNRSRGNGVHFNTYRSNFSGYGSTRQNTSYSSNTSQRHSSSNSNASGRDTCNNILDDSLLVRLNSLHDTNNGHVTMETDLPNLEEPVLNLSEVINGGTNAIAGAIADTPSTPVPTKPYNTINVITINKNGSYLQDSHRGSSHRQTDNVNLENFTLISETEQPACSNDENASDGSHQLHEEPKSVLESEAVDQSPNIGDDSSHQEHPDYELSFFNDSLEVETEVTIDICGDVDDENEQREQLTDPTTLNYDLDKKSESVPDIDSKNDRQTAGKDSDADESESLSQIIHFINSTAVNCEQACVPAPNSVSMEQLDQSLMDVDNITSTSRTSAKVVEVNQGTERILPHEKSSRNSDVQKQSTTTTHTSCENTKKLTGKSISVKPPCKVSHRRRTPTQEEAKRAADLPVKRLKMSDESESNANDLPLDKRTSHNGSKNANKPSKIHKRRKTIAAEWVICGSYQNTSELKEHTQEKSNKPSSVGHDQITIYDRHGEFAFVSSVAKFESLSSEQEKEKVAPVRIVKRRNTVAAQDVQDSKHKTKSQSKIPKESEPGTSTQSIDPHKNLKGEPKASRETLRKHIQTRRKSIAVSSDADKEAHATKQSTKPIDVVGRRPSNRGVRSKHSPSEDKNDATKKKEHSLMDLRIHLSKLPDAVGEMIPLREYVPPVYAKSSKKARPRSSKFFQLFGPDSDDETSGKSSKRSSGSKSSKRSTVDRIPWKLKTVDDFMLNRSIKHGHDSTCDDVLETVVEFNVEGMDKWTKEVAKRNDIEIELDTSTVTQVTIYSDTVIARQDCSFDTEIERIKEINNLMQMHCPSNVAIDTEHLVCVPDIPHQEEFQQPSDVLLTEEVEPPPEPVIRGKPCRGRGRGRSRGRGNRKITPLRKPPYVPPPLVTHSRSSTQATNEQVITHIEFCEALWERIFYNVKNCEMLVKQTNSYNKIQSVKQKVDLVLKRYHQTREKEVEELAWLTLGFLRKSTIMNFTYKEFLRSCYIYGGRWGMRVTVPALVKFLFSVVQKIKEIETDLKGFVQKFCLEVELEYENSVRWHNVRDDFILPIFPSLSPPPYVRANSEAEVTSTPVSVASVCSPAASASTSAVSASSTTAVITSSSTTRVSSPPIRSPPNRTPPTNISTVDLTTTESSPTAALVVKTPVMDRTLSLPNAVVPVREVELPEPEQVYGFTPVQRQLYDLQVLQYRELYKSQQRLLLEHALQQQCYTYYPSSSGFPRRAIGENEQTFIAPPGPATNPLNHNAVFYSSNPNPNVPQTSPTNPLINDNFRIRLPLLVPHNQVQITHVTPPSTPEIVATETPAPAIKRSSSPIAPTVVPPITPLAEKPIKEETTPTKPPVIVKTNNSPPLETANPSISPDNEQDVKPAVEPITVTFEDDEVIDVDHWFLEKMKQSDFIDLDDYDMPNTDPDEEDVKVEGPAQNLIVHPTLLEVERKCICSKRATLLCLCGLAIYCSSKCQTDDWCNHANVCASTRERKNA